MLPFLTLFAPAGELLVVQVVNDANEVVSSAVVRIDDEGIRHRVNHSNGKWRGRTIYPQNEQPQRFKVGQVVSITAAAPGHLPRTVDYQVYRHKNLVRIPLQSLGAPIGLESTVDVETASLMALLQPDCAPGSPMQLASTQPLSLDPETIRQLGDLEHADPQLTAGFAALMAAQGPSQFDAAIEWADIAYDEAHTTSGETYVALVDDLFRVRAITNHVRWQMWEQERIDSPSPQADAEAQRYRQASTRIAVEWVEWANAAGRSTALPSALCLASADQIERCNP